MVDSDELTLRVVEAVAEAEGCEPAELSPQLGRLLDSEALGELVDGGEGPGDEDEGDPVRVSFQYLGHDVRVRSSGAVEVDDRTVRG